MDEAPDPRGELRVFEAATADVVAIFWEPINIHTA
jgi:hypothetical protein